MSLELEDYSFLQFLVQEDIYTIKDFNPPANQTIEGFSFIGNHKKKVTVFLKFENSFEENFIKSPEWALLEKILQAVHLTLEDVRIGNILDESKFNFEKFYNSQNSEKIIVLRFV